MVMLHTRNQHSEHLSLIRKVARLHNRCVNFWLLCRQVFSRMKQCQLPFRARGHRTGMAVERLVHNSLTDFPCANKLSDCVMTDSFNLISPQAQTYSNIYIGALSALVASPWNGNRCRPQRSMRSGLWLKP